MAIEMEKPLPQDVIAQALPQSIAMGNVFTVAILIFFAVLVNINYLLFADYLEVGLYAFFVSQALHHTRDEMFHMVQTLREGKEEGSLLNMLTGALGEQTARVPKNAADVKAFLTHFSNGWDVFVETLVNHAFQWFLLAITVDLLISVLSLPGFVVVSTSFFVFTLLVLKIFDRRVLSIWSLCGLEDKTAISLFLLIVVFAYGGFAVMFLGVKTVFEGIAAVFDLSDWLQDLVKNNNETIGDAWIQAHQYIEQGFTTAKETYNESEWWPIANELFHNMQNGTDNVTELIYMTRDTAAGIYNDTPWFEQLDTLLNKTMAGDSEGLMNDSQGLMEHVDFGMVWGYVQEYAFDVVANPLAFVMQIFGIVSDVVNAVSELGSQFALFMFFVMNFLTSDDDVLTLGLKLAVPSSPSTRDFLCHEIRNVIEGVVYMPLQMGSLNALSCLVIMKFLQVEFAYLATFLVLIISFVPMLDPWLVCLPWGGALIFGSVGYAWRWLSITRGVLLVGAFYIWFGKIQEKVYDAAVAEGKLQEGLLTALSIGLGFGVYGWKGTILGPFVVCILLVCVRLRLKDVDAAIAEQARLASPEYAEQMKHEAEVRQEEAEQCAIAPKGPFHIFVYLKGKKETTLSRVLVDPAAEWEKFIFDVVGIVEGDEDLLFNVDTGENNKVVVTSTTQPGFPKIKRLNTFIPGETCQVEVVYNKKVHAINGSGDHQPKAGLSSRLSTILQKRK